MVAIVFLPDDSCLDGNEGGASSFGKWVKYLRPLAGRKNTGDDIARFEGVFIGLYDPLVPDDSSVGTGLAFFDVEEAPPKQGRPKALLDLHGLYSRIRKLFKERNHTDFQWAAESD